MNSSLPTSTFTIGPPISIVDESDDRLLYRVATQEMEALDVLYNRYASSIYSLVYRIVKDGSTAEGIVQETFLRVWQKANDFAATGGGAAWIFRIARNKALDQLRRNRARPVPSDRAIEEHYDITDSDNDEIFEDIETTLDRGYHLTHLNTALARIPEAQRHCLELAYFEGMSHREIAAHTNTPVGTIKTRIKMGMQKLALLLNTAGYQRALS
jgi:RNA polymerase sigma-70 factor (ECF subfamily)